MKCNACDNEHDGKYGSGRFCCKACACSFATKAKRASINEAVSAKLSGRPNPLAFSGWHVIPPEQKAQIYAKIGKTIKAKYAARTFDEMGSFSKREVILEEQQGSCAICALPQTWNGKPLRFELDHVDGDRLNEDRSNLRLICPNCHSQTPTWGSRNAKGEARERMLSGKG